MIKIMGIKASVDADTPCKRVDFSIEGMGDIYSIKGALAVSSVNLPTQSLPRELVRQISKELGIFIQVYDNVVPSILIGQDNWELLVSREVRCMQDLGIALSLTRLGWVAHGHVQPSQHVNSKDSRERALETSAHVSCVTCVEQTEGLEALVREYFKIESMGVREVERVDPAQARALETLQRTSRQVNVGWETGLLWRSNTAPALDSRATALKRLHSIERRLDRDQEYARLYYPEMERLIAQGYAREVDNETTTSRVWYLPHFGVVNAAKPGKIRIVFDAAAATKGVSLNDQLDAGPDLLQSLPGVLLRFRQYAVACKSDIRDMFMRVYIRPEDRSALRFLWRGASRDKNPHTYEMTRLVFGAKSSPCSAHFVKDTNAQRFETTKPEAARSIIKNSDVDDFLVSRPSVEQLEALVEDVVGINRQANFEMHGWACNEVMRVGGPQGTTSARQERAIVLCDKAAERVLGMYWDPKVDTSGLNVGLTHVPANILQGCVRPTKREYLRFMMSVYDPLGLLEPYTTRSKLILQAIWRSGIGWDEPLRDEEDEAWREWLDTVKKLNSLRVSRCITPKGRDIKEAQIHVFCDASTRAFAACAYLRCETTGGCISVTLLMAKSRVAPDKPHSVPRLELQAAVLASRLLNTVSSEIEIPYSCAYLWSDSRTVLHWIQRDPRVRQAFVAHRLGEISERTANAKWKWVPTKENPVDAATRGKQLSEIEEKRWFRGPNFLVLPETQWPTARELTHKEREVLEGAERRPERVALVVGSSNYVPFVARVFGWEGHLLAAQRVRRAYMRWKQVKAARVARSKGQELLQQAQTKDQDLARQLDEEYVLRAAQGDSFARERHALAKGQKISAGSKLIPFLPFLDDRGLIRIKGRVTCVAGAEFNHTPIVLDGKHNTVRAIVRKLYYRWQHGYHETVVNELLQRYVVFGARPALRAVCNQCLICKMRRGRPQPPLMAALPEGRLAYRQRPFTHCGVDYFGPMLVKIGRSRVKRWGVLFTCLTTRAVHLEIACSLATSSMIMALQRMAARRGCPAVIYSDNGTNFRGACTELQTEVARLDRQRQKEYASKNGIRWFFSPPEAPHMGGSWERLVRSVKVALHATLKDEVPSEEVLCTVLAEAEHVVNSRPLTHVSVHPGDGEALTPNHFLIGTASGSVNLAAYSLPHQWHLRIFLDNHETIKVYVDFDKYFQYLLTIEKPLEYFLTIKKQSVWNKIQVSNRK
ncbi:uncharacterized protein LOC106645853 [Copidosoma floridanum]|uniref:uncharacterized protein LOC106645853 n=1 Tax=Copidosoma floridanum TaxID=29053 RepID=UPI0006C9A34A|nr:uncharacterized protein LOC106645853 [Copidosoma floridanum]